jgi:hypothetical protein
MDGDEARPELDESYFSAAGVLWFFCVREGDSRAL